MALLRIPFLRGSYRSVSMAAAFGLAVALPTTVAADGIAAFYAGKTINVLIGVNVGGGYDLQARLVARHIGKHIPGNPKLVAINVVGAGGLKMANQLYNIAAQDGTSIGMMPNTLVAMQAVNGPGVRFDANKFHWIGTMSTDAMTMATWHESGVKTLEDARKKETVAAASSRGAITYTFPHMLNVMLGTRFKIVTGYQGTSQMSLAMERREADGVANTWSSWTGIKPQWVKEKKIHILVQTRPKSKDLPDVPLVEELAKNDDDRKVIELIVSGGEMGKPMALTPNVPAERVKAIRDAFDATMKDPALLKEAAAAKIDVDPVRGVELQKMVEKVLATPKHLAEKARTIIVQ